LNAPGGTLRLDGVPARYAPGQLYRISVRLARAEMAAAGFQMSARFASGEREGAQAGEWRSLDERVRTVTAQGLQFIQQTALGAESAPGATQWTVEWMAPPAAWGPVEFDVAANASNDDASALGDFIYLASARSAP
jgi:hypothetical protein